MTARAVAVVEMKLPKCRTREEKASLSGNAAVSQRHPEDIHAQICNTNLAIVIIFAFNRTGQRCECQARVLVHLFVMSHHLVLLPRSLEVQAAVLSALNDCPSTAGCFHVAIHLHSGDRNERRSVGKPVFEHIKTLIAPIGLFFFYEDQEEVLNEQAKHSNAQRDSQWL